MNAKINVGDRFGRLTVLRKSKSEKRRGKNWVCECICGNQVDVSDNDLFYDDTKSCGCLKKEIEEVNLREKYEEKRVGGVALHLFNDKPRKHSSIGYRGVSRYYTRVSKEERYRAWITVDGKHYYKSGFKTPEEAYEKGRLMLEAKHLPKRK